MKGQSFSPAWMAQNDKVEEGKEGMENTVRNWDFTSKIRIELFKRPFLKDEAPKF